MSNSLERAYLAPALQSYLLDLANATRRHPALSLGMSPRGVLALQRIVRAHAAAEGRAYATPDDVKKLARYVIPHRLLVTPESRMRGTHRSTSSRRFSTQFLSSAPAGADMPTRTGWGLLVAGVVFVVSGRLFGAIEFLVVGIAAVAAVVMAVLLRQLDQADSSVVRQLTPPQVPVGEPARVDLEVINRGRSRSPVLRLLDAVAGTRGVDLALRRSPATVRSTAPTVCPPPVEGCSISDPSGSTTSKDSGSHASDIIDTRVRLIVHPPIEALPPIRVPAGDDPLLGEELRQSLGLSDEEFDGLRPYVPGDDLRKIHWPSSARGDELQVRQFRPRGTAASRS